MAPLGAFPIIATRDAEAMRDALLSTYSNARAFEVAQRGAAFFGRGHDCALTHSAISYCHYEAPVRFSFDESRFVRQQLVLTGAGETRLGSTTLPASPDRAAIIPADARTRLDYAAGLRQLIVRFDVDALARKLTALTGAPVAALRFEAMTDGGSPEGERLRRTVQFLIDEIDATGGDTAHLEIAELEQLMMVSFLHASRHTHRDLLARPPAQPAPWQVRRAEEYICANLDKTLTIEAIAEATGASARVLFTAFRRSRGYSPMVFAKMQRLERARRLLQAPDAATTVTGIALQCGFLNQGHFARDYRAHFGELPSQTLRRAR